MKEKLSFIFIVLLLAMGVFCMAELENPVDTSGIESDISTIQTNAYLKSEQILLYQNLDANGNWITNLAGVIMAGDINLASNEITEVKSMTLADAGVKFIDGKVNGTNYFGMVDSSNNTFRILLTIPQP